MNDKADFTQGSILKKLIAFMIPVLGALILQAAYGAVDLLVVGRFGSTSGLSAVSTGSQVLNLVTFVVTQFAMGITVLIARYLGEKRPEQIGSVIGGSAVVFTMIAVGLFIVMVGFAHPISVLMQAPKEAVELTSVYVRICGGGIPIIRPLNKCLTADEIEEITGILNGTTNYMLTKMAEEGADFDEVLKDAQEKGYAEKDPTADIEGHDPCRKIAILTSLVCGRQVDFEDIHCEGITKITADDFKYAKVLNRSIKLLASSRKVGNSYSCMVAPFMLSAEHPLCGVNGVFNGIFVHGNVLGDAMFYGSGAGKLPTASAVVADIVDMTKHKNTNIYIDWSPEKLTLVDYKDSVNSFFVRTSSGKETIENAFGSVEYADAGIAGEIGFTTKDMTEAEFEKAAAQIEVRNRIRLG